MAIKTIDEQTKEKLTPFKHSEKRLKFRNQRSKEYQERIKTIMDLRFVDGYSMVQIGRALGISREAVRQQINNHLRGIKI